MASQDGEPEEMSELRHQEIQRKETEGAKDMIPTEVVLRIDARGMSLIEVEQICRNDNILEIIRAMPGRVCRIDLATVEELQA